MNRLILILTCCVFCCVLLSSCNSVFVWTLDDVIGLSCVGIVLLWIAVSVIRDLFFPKKKK